MPKIAWHCSSFKFAGILGKPSECNNSDHLLVVVNIGLIQKAVFLHYDELNKFFYKNAYLV